MIMLHSIFVFTHEKLYNSGHDYIDDDWVWKVNIATIFFLLEILNNVFDATQSESDYQ